MGKLGTQELLIILCIALLIFGPKKLPQLGKAIGKEMRASLAVTDQGLSDSIMKHLQTIQE